MKTVSRENIHMARLSLQNDLSLMKVIPEGEKKTEVRRLLNEWAHGRCTGVELENALAFAIGFNIVEG